MTGYKLCRHIGKALQRRSEAIQNALNRYNTQAAKLNPPRPNLSWKEIVEYTFLAEFDLLRNSRTDVRQHQWAQPAYREGLIKYFKLCRAREEINRLDLEIPRLRTRIHDDTIHVRQVLGELVVSNPSLGAALQRWWTLRSSVNVKLIQQLDRIEGRRDFTGKRGIGVRLGSTRREGQDVSLEPAREVPEHDPSTVDEQVGELERLADFMLHITD